MAEILKLIVPDLPHCLEQSLRNRYRTELYFFFLVELFDPSFIFFFFLILSSEHSTNTTLLHSRLQLIPEVGAPHNSYKENSLFTLYAHKNNKKNVFRF